MLNQDEIYSDSEHYVFDVSNTPKLYHFNRMIDDLVISSPDGDVLLSWRVSFDSAWDDQKCMILKDRDNLKEFNNLKTTMIALKSANEQTIRVYCTIQRN